MKIGRAEVPLSSFDTFVAIATGDFAALIYLSIIQDLKIRAPIFSNLLNSS